jgi:DNA-binding beta-propeller fold protein YncE
MKKLTLFFLLFVISCSAFSQRYLYFTDTELNLVGRYSLAVGENEIIVPNENTPRGIAIDYERGRMFYADGEEHTIIAVDLNGQNPVSLGWFSAPADLFLDKDLRLLYVSDVQDNTIYTIDLKTMGKKRIIQNVDKPRHIAVDPFANRLFYTGMISESASVLYSANLDGTESRELFESTGYIAGIVLDRMNKHIYWLERSGSVLNRSGYDGGSILTIAETSPLAYILEYDDINGFIYWGEKDLNRIMRYSMDQNDASVFMTHVPDIGGMALDLKSACRNFVTVYDTISVTDTLIIDIDFPDADCLGQVKVYPNPTLEMLTIDIGSCFDLFIGSSLVFTYGNGAELWRSSISSPTFTFAIREMFASPGLYFLTIWSHTGEVLLNKKIVLQ